MKDEVLNAIELLRKSGFSNANILLNLPSETYTFEKSEINQAFECISRNHHTINDSDFDELVLKLYEI